MSYNSAYAEYAKQLETRAFMQEGLEKVETLLELAFHIQKDTHKAWGYVRQARDILEEHNKKVKSTG